MDDGFDDLLGDADDLLFEFPASSVGAGRSPLWPVRVRQGWHIGPVGDSTCRR